MYYQENQIYKWMVRRGSILIAKDGDKVHLELDKESSESCQLTEKDTDEILSILTTLSRSIWDKPDYVKEPYNGKSYKIDESNDLVYWELGETTLYLGFDENEDVLEINYSGDSVVKASINTTVEIIQIMDHFYGQFKS